MFTGATSGPNILWLIVAFALFAYMVYMLFFKKYKETTKPERTVKVN